MDRDAAPSPPPPSINEDDLQILSSKNAIKRKYPPGCPVLYNIQSSATSFDTCRGIIEAVYINLETNGFVYRIKRAEEDKHKHSKEEDKHKHYFREDQLDCAMNYPITGDDQRKYKVKITGRRIVKAKRPPKRCANCGKEGGDSMNACNKCDLVKYCNAACKKKHKSTHKKECEVRAAELHDEKLFKEPPSPEDCPICFLPQSVDVDQTYFFSCCGKHICNGCVLAIKEREGTKLCAFCRTPISKSDEESIKQLENLMENGNAYACKMLGGFYVEGSMGIPQDYAKGHELYLKAGELGCADAYHNLGCSYYHGRGVDIDKKKAKYYWQLAAMNRDVYARHNLGANEYIDGNHHRAFKHYMLAASAGFKQSLDAVKEGFVEGYYHKK